MLSDKIQHRVARLNASTSLSFTLSGRRRVLSLFFLFRFSSNGKKLNTHKKDIFGQIMDNYYNGDLQSPRTM